MTKILLIGMLALTAMLITGCDKEKIVETTEYIHDVEYVELPPDTVIQVDTLVSHDSILVYRTDTLVMYDTTIQTIVDTVIQVNNVYDTVLIYDTIVTVQQQFDTVWITDTVLNAQCSPNEHFAFAEHYLGFVGVACCEVVDYEFVDALYSFCHVHDKVTVSG